MLAAGGYQGRDIGFQIDQSGHEATRIDVQVNRTDKPVALLLGAYEPTVWNVSWSPQTKIVAVLLSGYHHQAVAGLDPSVPRIVSTYDNRGSCGYAYVNERDLSALNPLSRHAFGRDVELAYLTENGRALVGERLPSSQSWGLLRPARASDAEDWADAVMAETRPGSGPPIAGRGPARPPPPLMFRAYVVLKPMKFPAGLYGGNSATFFVPKGVERPTGDPGHSVVFDFNTVTCSGALCQAGR